MSNYVHFFQFFSETTNQKSFIYHDLLHFINRIVTTTVPLGTFIYIVLQISQMGDKRFENGQTANLVKVLTASVTMRQLLIGIKNQELTQTENENVSR